MSDIQALRLREQDLAGKVAVITGASKGIGRATAIHLASRGCSILGTCSGPDTLHLIDSIDHTVSKLYKDKPSPPKIFAIVADITKPDCADAIARALENNFEGHVDILVNNAALTGSAKSKLGDLDASTISNMLFANVQTPLMIVNELVKRKMFCINSRIVNVSSDAARMAIPISPGGRTLYSTVKTALEGLSRAWADELGGLIPDLEFMKGTTSNSVSVGFTQTAMTRQMPPHIRENVNQLVLSRQSLGPRAAEAEDVADVIGFLCGRDSRWVTGAVIPANGGHCKIT